VTCVPGDLDIDAVFRRGSPEDTFAAVLTEAKMVLGEINGPLEAERWGSDILAALGGAGSALAQAMVSASDRSETPEALAILRVLAAVGEGDLRSAASDAASRLAAAGLPDPPWSAEIGDPAIGACWRYSDTGGLQEAVTMSFGYTSGWHVVSVLLDHSCGGGIKNVWVGEAGDVLARTKALASEDSGMVFEMISPAAAGAAIRRAEGAGECPANAEEISNLASARAIVRSRAALLPG
jgi:hypothetical protein